MSTRMSETNGAKLRRMEEVLRELLDESLQRGFYGTAAIEISVQDGTIQHLRRRVERIER